MHGWVDQAPVICCNTGSRQNQQRWSENPTVFLLFIRLISFSWCLLYTRMIAEQACYRFVKKSAILMAYSREGICCCDSILAIVFRLMPVADASSFWVMPRSALASTSLQVIVSVTVFMSISISVFIYMHLQRQIVKDFLIKFTENSQKVPEALYGS